MHIGLRTIRVITSKVHQDFLRVVSGYKEGKKKTKSKR